MDGRRFLAPARDLAAGPTEAHRRAAAGRAYYAALHEARDALARWGVAIPPRDNIHTSTRLRFLYATDPEPRDIGRGLDQLADLRNEADYRLGSPGRFATDTDARLAIAKADELIALLDAIEADPARRAEVAASIRP